MNSTILYFDRHNRWHALNLISAYSNGFSDRILSGFDNIEAEADAAAEKYFQDRMNQPCSDYDGPWEDEASVADDAREHGFDIYSDLEFVRRQVTGLAITGLSHLWERILKEFLTNEFSLFNPPIVPRDRIHRADFEGLVDMLKDQGWDAAKENFYGDLDLLRLVTNVVKHGEGKSCHELIRRAPEMFIDFGHPWMNEGHGADDLRLLSDHFSRFVAATREFFENFPDRLPRRVE